MMKHVRGLTFDWTTDQGLDILQHIPERGKLWNMNRQQLKNRATIKRLMDMKQKPWRPVIFLKGRKGNIITMVDKRFIKDNPQLNQWKLWTSR